MTEQHHVEFGHFGWACSCGAGRDWPLAPIARARTAANAHLRAVHRRDWRYKDDLDLTAEDIGEMLDAGEPAEIEHPK